MAKLLVVLIALGCILLPQSHLVASLQCYSCSGVVNSISECTNLLNVYPSICGSDQVCATFVLHKSTADILHRKCASSNICNDLEIQYQRNPVVTVKECNVCNEDNCNSAPAL
ncbi:hypothetical protein Zmor_023124 [Zophobas morio]|uniref:Protein quiver n=1 Tax=Zophobas morio TaxID=2755281 RepID=A0AA38M768_9CUCU|nr:hypothetical protein Zmor_023124 [Zophobas morio]